MKKLLLFSILFLTCSLGLMNAKADDSLFYDEPLVIEKNIFDSETYNLADCDKIYGLSYYRFRELYPDNYESLVSFFEENEYHYVFGANGLLYWKEDDLEYLVVARSDSDGPGIMGGLYNPSRIKVYKSYYNASISGSNISSNISNTSDKFITSYGNIFYQRRSSNTNINGYNPNFYEYGVVFDTNINIRFDTDYYVENVNPPTNYKFYHSIVVDGKTYNSGSYVYSTSSKVSNPKISLKYLTTTGDETGAKIGATVSVDFNVFDKSRYSYLISFDNGNSWDGLTPRMTSSVYTFSKLENFQVLAQLYDSETGKSYYSTLLVDSIDMSYHSRWLRFQRNSEKDKYLEIDGQTYLYSSQASVYQDYNELNDYPFNLYYSYDGTSWKSLPNKACIDLEFKENTTLYFIYRDQANQIVYRTTYTVDYFTEIQKLGVKIQFEEKCENNKCQVTAYYINGKDSYFYWIASNGDKNNYHLEFPSQDRYPTNKFPMVYIWDETDTITTYCTRVNEHSTGEVLAEECYTIKGITVEQNMNTFTKGIIEFINNQKNTLDRISDLIQKMYNDLPTLIKNFLVFSYFLLCMSAIIWNIRK